MEHQVTVVGAGLAGSEAAWQLAKRGIRVKLIEMKPEKMTPAHVSADFAELVCSNSFRSDELANAVVDFLLALRLEITTLESLQKEQTTEILAFPQNTQEQEAA